MSTEMDAVKLYCDTLASDLRTRADSVEHLGAKLRAELSVSLSLVSVRNLARLLDELGDISFRLENIAAAEQRRAEAAESAAALAMAVVAHLREEK